MEKSFQDGQLYTSKDAKDTSKQEGVWTTLSTATGLACVKIIKKTLNKQKLAS